MNRPIHLPILLFIGLLLSAFAPAFADVQGDYFIATDGNDAWSGKLDRPNPARTDGPFATLAGARDAIRKQRGDRKQITLLIRAGTYSLSQTLELTPEDSGLHVLAYPGEKVILSGGRKITRWTKAQGNLWTAPVPDAWSFHQLFVNGQRQTPARHPNQGYLRTDGPIEPLASDREQARRDPKTKIGFRYKPGDLKSWDNLDDVNIILYHSWTASRHWIASLDENQRIVRFTAPSGWPVAWWEKNQRYHLENVFEALDQPGEWYLNRKTGLLYYWPAPGVDLTTADVVAPALRQLVILKGDPTSGKFVENVKFAGLSFQHADWSIKDRGPADGQSAVNFLSAAIHATGAKNCIIENCEIAHVGEYALWLAQGCRDNVVRHCHIHDLGAGGVCIGDTRRSTRDDATRQDASHNIIDNNFIHDGGHAWLQAVGVWIGQSSYNQITHNDICDFFYTGVSVGWTWGYGASAAHHNQIDNNHIHHLGFGVLSDMGGIYTLGISPGTTLRYNLMHDIYAYDYGGWGLYTDEGSTGILMENNIVYNTKTGGFHQHYGKENILRNNILAFAWQGQIQRTRKEPHLSFTFERNIVVGDHEAMLASNWDDDQYAMDHNLYWNTAGDVEFMGMDFAQWQKKGQDTHSLVADPRFIDASARDLRLRDDSPAFKLGFQPIDQSKMGLYGDPAWVNAPKSLTHRPVEIQRTSNKISSLNEDFEQLAVGDPPPRAHVSGQEKGASIAVSADAAAGGTKSLKFTDKPNLSAVWQPHLYYQPNLTGGVVKIRFDLRLEQGATLYHEWRDSSSPYRVGPSIQISPNGELKANRQTLAQLPVGQWIHFEFTCPLGPGAGQYQLALTLPNRQPQRFQLPTSTGWRSLRWLGFSSLAKADAVFYVDNLQWEVEKTK